MQFRTSSLWTDQGLVLYMCAEGFYLQQSTHTCAGPSCMQWVDIRIILAGCRGCKVHSSSASLFSVKQALPVLPFIHWCWPGRVLWMWKAWVSQPEGPGRLGGSLLKGSWCSLSPSGGPSCPCCSSFLTRAMPHSNTSPYENENNPNGWIKEIKIVSFEALTMCVGRARVPCQSSPTSHGCSHWQPLFWDSRYVTQYF